MPRTTERARVLKQLQLLQHNSQLRRQKWLARRAQQQRSQRKRDEAQTQSTNQQTLDVYADTEPNDSEIDTDSDVSEEQLDGPEVFTSRIEVDTSQDFRSLHYSRPFDYSNMLEKLSSLRYWQSRRVEDRGVKALSVETWFHQCWFEKPRIFRGHFRMSHDNFERLLDQIKDNAIFYNNAHVQQTPPRYQLAVFLYRLGSKGQGGTQLHTATAIGIGEGTVRNFTERVLYAVLCLRKQYIKWPTPQEKEAMKQRICSASCGVFPGCVGFIDGTFVTLQYAPLTDWYFYYNRKSSYALNAMVVCTDQCRITYFRVGDTSAVHDARVFENSRLSSTSADFFSPGEYLIGDSAYSVSDTMIAPFKKPRSTEPACRQFNSTLSSRRIAIEHLFGQLKARFPSITAIGTRISGKETHQQVVNWFEAACVVHNFLLDADELEWDVREDLEMARIHQEEVEELRRTGANDTVLDRTTGRRKNKKDQLRESILQCMINNHMN